MMIDYRDKTNEEWYEMGVKAERDRIRAALPEERVVTLVKDCISCSMVPAVLCRDTQGWNTYRDAMLQILQEPN